MKRRKFMGVAVGAGIAAPSFAAEAKSHAESLREPVDWKRDPRNPILPPGRAGSFDSTRCMNPWAMRVDDDYHLYYSGGDDQGHQRICLATAKDGDLGNWNRHGPLFDLGEPGAFDANWCVLPHVVKFGPEQWHLYFTGNSGRGKGLSAFPGIGLATSTDGKTWTKHSGNPVLERSGKEGDPDAIGMAGGSLIKVGKQWRFYFTGCPTVGADLFLNQNKTICLAISDDGIHWEKKGAVMLRDSKRDYENVGVAGPVVHSMPDGKGFRMWYSAIGSRWGYYSICYAESDDGFTWRRGEEIEDNLQLRPHGDDWEKQMVEYPSIIPEGDRLRLFYCGNGYGKTGIGTALSL